MNTEQRFWAKVNRSGPVPDHSSQLGPCWLWTAALTRDGYGHFGTSRQTWLAHRYAYELSLGPVAEAFELDHLCRVRSCVNPAHLEPVTGRENNRRGVSFSAENARKTHCNNGHPFDEVNTYIRPSGHRDCRVCIRERARQYRRRKAAA